MLVFVPVDWFAENMVLGSASRDVELAITGTRYVDRSVLTLVHGEVTQLISALGESYLAITDFDQSPQSSRMIFSLQSAMESRDFYISSLVFSLRRSQNSPM